MSATILMNGKVASIVDWRWESEDVALAKYLNSLLDPYGPSPSNPQPDINEAHRVVELFGGEVLKEVPSISEPDVVY